MRKALGAFLALALASMPLAAGASPPPLQHQSQSGVPVGQTDRTVLGQTAGKPHAVTALGLGLFPNCERNPHLIVCEGAKPVKGDGRLTLAEVEAIDSQLRLQFKYQLDEVTYPKYVGTKYQDYWADNVTVGDCEDYALTLARMLNTSGEGGQDMALMLWIPVPDAGHATLIVDTVDAGAIEIGVGAEPPTTLDMGLGKRLAMIPLDGSKDAILLVPKDQPNQRWF